MTYLNSFWRRRNSQTDEWKTKEILSTKKKKEIQESDRENLEPRQIPLPSPGLQQFILYCHCNAIDRQASVEPEPISTLI